MTLSFAPSSSFAAAIHNFHIFQSYKNQSELIFKFWIGSAKASLNVQQNTILSLFLGLGGALKSHYLHLLIEEDRSWNRTQSTFPHKLL